MSVLPGPLRRLLNDVKRGISPDDFIARLADLSESDRDAARIAVGVLDWDSQRARAFVTYVPHDVWLFHEKFGEASPDRAEIDYQLGLDPLLPPESLLEPLKLASEEWWGGNSPTTLDPGDLADHILVRTPRDGPNGEVEYMLHPPGMSLRDVVEGPQGWGTGISGRPGVLGADFSAAIEAWLNTPLDQAFSSGWAERLGRLAPLGEPSLPAAETPAMDLAGLPPQIAIFLAALGAIGALESRFRRRRSPLP